ncbi:TonB-dependent receptor plug domain-containing protein [Sphingomonas sp. M1-B02]|uniref:TonB-dependent receptor plug domain-containing protein n=1 Tax=Sphingomonas sp. M1-B02 TaxID=3114300 RepID=UPI00223F02FB|nr:TonB-dependent receptor [Sphingomonas sp. S6-11]UZK66570.1 TonB-dependent receptor [Sphingomonas sp. S6-11]
MKKTMISMLALAAASPALAQADQDQTNPGDAILVTASRSGDAVRADQIGASVTVLDAEALDRRQTRRVSDILRDVPGVAVNSIAGQGQVRIRGAEGNQVLVLIDGIEAADPYVGEFDFSTLLADPAARIEVLRGQQSSLYGSDAIGGVINYITLSGAEAPGLSARAEGGSFGTYNGNARAAGASDTFDYAVSGSFYHSDGTPNARGGARNLGSESVTGTAKLNWMPSPNLKLSAVGRYSQLDADSNNSELNPASPRFGTIVDSPGVRFNNRAFYGLVSAELTALDGRWTNALSAQFADTTRKGYNQAGLDSGDKGQRYKASFVSSFRFGTGSVVHRITGAVDLERESFRNITPSPFAFQGKRDTDNLGLVGQYELTVADRLSLGGSVRHDDNNRFGDPTTWRVQGSYRLPTDTRIRAAYGTGVKNPGYFELYGYSDGRYIGNPNLKPEKSEGWEAGIEQSFGEGRATIGATYFDSTLKDEIYTTYPAPIFVATPGNRTTDSRQHGVEIFVSARPIPQLRLDATYTYLDAEENGAEEVRRPKHLGSFNATVLSKDERFAGTLTVRYNGRMTDITFTDPTYASSPVVSLQEFVLVNFNADYKISDKVSLFGRVENLFDERYEEVFSFATQGRGAFGGVRVAF